MNAGPVEILFLFVLILGNGFLAMSEIAIVSARKALLQSRAAGGSKRYQVALETANAPGNFLSTVQVGITLVGVLTGAVGQAALSEPLSNWFVSLGLTPAASDLIGVGVVVIAITYFSLILGELAPKQIGLIHAERVAAAVAPVIRVFSQITRPVVWLLSRSSTLVVRLLGIHPAGEPAVTEEEVKVLIDRGTELGVFEPVEDAIVDQVFRLGDQKAISITVPRGEITWLDLEDPPQVNIDKIQCCDYSNFPVAKGDLDHLQGFVRSNDLLGQFLSGQELDLQGALQPPLFLAENLPVFEALKRFRETGDEFAFVLDEYGGVQGLITLGDILNALVEDLPSLEESQHPSVVRRADGTWLVDGTMPVDEFRETFGLKELPGEAEGVFLTLGGFIMSMLGKIPDPGTSLEWEGLRIEVMDMDGRRVDKVLVAPVNPEGNSQANEPGLA
jgi:putative hemolysin